MVFIPVTNRDNFRAGYEFLAILKSMENDVRVDRKLVSEYIVDQKRELRKYSHKNTHELMAIWAGIVERRIAWSYGIDGYVELITFPEEIDSARLAEELFRAYIRMEYRPTYYDCTGQHFTRWYKVFKRGGRYCVYHSIGIDI